MMRFALILIALFSLAAPADGGSVRLNARAAIEAGRPVTLGDIATLEGDGAAALASTVLFPEAQADQAWLEVDVVLVREALESAGAPMSRLTVGGDRCVVSLLGAMPDQGDATPARRERREPTAIEQSERETLRMRIASTLAHRLGTGVADMKLLFDEEDESWVDTPIGRRTVIVQPTTHERSKKLGVAVRVYDPTGSTMLDERRLMIGALVRTRALVLNASFRRGDPIGPGDVSASDVWLEPSGAAPVTDAEFGRGAVARTRVHAGQVLREGEIEPPIAIKRGDLVTVRCVRGGIEVKVRARACEDGRRGDDIELRVENSRQSFVARVQGPGLAVLGAGTTTDAD